MSAVMGLTQHDAARAPARRADAGSVRLSGRDITGLLLCAEQTQLTDLQNSAEPENDPTLLDELPYLTANLAQAPAGLLGQLIAATDIQCLYRKDKNQVTIRATITPATPATVAALLSDPRTDDPGTDIPEPVSSLAQGPIGHH